MTKDFLMRSSGGAVRGPGKGPALGNPVICWYCRGLSGFCRWSGGMDGGSHSARLCTVKSAVFGQEGGILE